MKSHEIADQLEAIAKLLRSLPNTEMRSALEALFDLTSKPEKAVKPSSRSSIPLPNGLEMHLAKMTPAEIERHLGADDESAQFTTAHLLELADRLGIPTSKRQSRSALINMIVRHFEAGQLDSMIQRTGRDET